MTTRTIRRGDIDRTDTGASINAAIRARQRRWPARTEPIVYSQTEQRTRRRNRVPVALDGRFDLGVEVAAILGPVAEVVAAEPSPGSYLAATDEVIEATFAAVSRLADLLADRDARGQLDAVRPDDRGRARRALRALAPHPTRPTLTRADLVAGSWAATLADMARPFTEPLADYLGRTVSPDGEPSAVSDTVVEALREIDRAALSLTRRAERAAFYRAECAAPPTKPEADRHRETLRELGIEP
ncbi:hypothetical protein R4144_12760 [Gordonia amicalis]|uniref:hypothetical protein n=1 Tax=Gordonia amicalis TaxID=89053 RepID=UPI0029538841|nr:hypothetical protein [Gordonia amicalis]MDV7174230.1 hypothetical protein [Gordonia amicalis]